LHSLKKEEKVRVSRAIKLIGLGMIILFSFTFGHVLGEAGTIQHSVHFSISDLKFEKAMGFDVVTLSGCDITRKVAEPQLPVQVVNIALPPGMTVEGFRIVALESKELEGAFSIYPVQPPQILGMPGKRREKVEFVEPREEIYSSSAPYPEEIIQYTGTGSMSGYPVAGFLIHPICYIPAQKKLVFYRRIDLSVSYVPDGKAARLVHASAAGLQQRNVKEMVVNPEDVGGISTEEAVAFSILFPDTIEYEYVIITGEDYVSSFQPLADWKTKKGVPSRIVTTSWIYENYPGVDDQEMIRNFIKDAHQNWQTTWVLLGGDIDVVPVRTAFAMDCEYGSDPRENDIPCDLYYADLGPGDWSEDGNDIFGEVTDSVDLYPDVYVGRAPGDSSWETPAWVAKVLTYEKSPPTDYQLNMLFLGEVLWNNPFTDGGVGKDMIDDNFVPSRFDPITKLYQTLGNENITTVMAAMNQGQNMINHDGHAWWNVMSVGSDFLHIGSAYDLTNGPRYSIFYSIGCWPGAFDFPHDPVSEWDCVGECLLQNPNGGCVAFIGNSRYGWGSPGNPGWGYSDIFDHQFYRFLFQEDVYHIGATLAEAKAYYITRSRQENVYRWHQYQVNLLGDPEMSIWTDMPKTLTVDHPETITTGSSEFTVCVSQDWEPLSGSLVCMMKGSEVYRRGTTDSNGQVIFSIWPTSPGSLSITVTAHNFLPYEGYSKVSTNRPYIALADYSLNDQQNGNGDGLMNPGEVVKLSISLQNFGNEQADSVGATLRSREPLVALIDSFATFGDISPGSMATTLDTFFFAISSLAKNGEVVSFTLHITDSMGSSWDQAVNLPVATPHLVYKTHTVDDDGNGIPEPGEWFELTVLLKNEGLATAKGVTAILLSTEEGIGLDDTLIELADVPSDSSSRAMFTLEIDSLSPVPHFSKLGLRMTTADGYSFSDGFLLNVGVGSFFDNMEEGEGNWEHGGSGDLWHLSTHRSHSGGFSWYCGHEGTFKYDNEMDCALVTPSFTLLPSARLSFWHWFEVTTYGVDGIYVEIDVGSGWEILDFIGSGGALDSLLMIGNDWLEETYDLSSYPVGRQARIRFRFVSDLNDRAEGSYIDDVSVYRDYGSSRSQLALSEYSIDDDRVGESFGNSNGYVDVGENIELTTKLENYGDAVATEVTAKLWSRDPYVTLLDSIESYGDIGPGAQIGSGGCFCFAVADDVPVNHRIYFSLIISDSKGNLWDNSLVLQVTQPEFDLSSLIINDIEGDGDYIPEAGETCDFWAQLKNLGTRRASGITAVLRTNVPMVSLTDSLADFEDIGIDSTGDNRLSPFRFELDSGLNPGQVIPFRLQVSEGEESFTQELNFHIGIGWGRILLVADDGLGDLSSYYTEVLDNLGGIYDLWDVLDDGPVGMDLLQKYRNVIWFFGGEVSTLTLEDQANLEAYLDRNGSTLFLSGQWGLYDIRNSAFYSDYLSSQYINFSTGLHHLNGVNGNPVVGETQISLSDSRENEQAYAGEIDPVGSAFSIFEYDTTTAEGPGNIVSSGSGAVAIDNGNYRVVFFAFGWEGIEPFDSRLGVMADVLGWLWGLTGIEEVSSGDEIPSKFFLSQNYPNPFNQATVIRYGLPKSGRVKLEVFNILGEKVRTLFDGEQGAGYYTIRWDGLNDSGKEVSSGIYFYGLDAGTLRQNRKLLILR
jgi:hypothetical protein